MNESSDILVFGDAVKSIIQLLRERGEVKNVYYLAPQIVGYRWRLDIKIKTIYPRVIEFFEECMNLESVKKCLNLMLERNFPEHLEMTIVDSSGKPVENPDYKPFLMTEILGTLVNRYLESYGFDFNEEKFKKLYDEMVKHVYSKGRELVIVSPLENFELQGVNEASIGEYKVRELNEWELKELINYGYPLGWEFRPEFGDIEIRYCVEITVNVPKRSLSPPEPYIEDFVTMLRLFKRGSVKHGYILHYPKIWRTSWGASLGGYIDRFHIFTNYILTEEDITPLSLFVQQFLKVKNQFPNPMKFAIRWFNKSYREVEALDKLLDLAIALEVLFGTSDRLDLYVPHFIGSNKEERERLNKDIRKLREIRGSIVHSGYYKVEQEFIDKIEDIFRACISKFINLLPSLTYEKIIENIRISLLE
ncbi:MAG: HEPN domain-containing protein [Thermoprotei archaeon]